MSNIQVFNGTLAGKEQSLTTTRIVAGAFNKRHDDVLKAVRNLDCSQEFADRNFAASEYRDRTGRRQHEYRMTRDGFMFLAMGFTGAEAARRKEGFIATFNDMEERLHRQVTAAPNDALDRMLTTMGDMLNGLRRQVEAQGMQIERLTRGLLAAKDVELRMRRQQVATDIQRRIDRVILMEADGLPRESIVAETGLSFNYVRQIIFRARKNGDLPPEATPQASLDLAGSAS